MEGSHPARQAVQDVLKQLGSGLVTDPDAMTGWSPVRSDEIPEPFHSLLVHRDHMTTRLEDRYGIPLQLRVLAERLDGDVYRRKIRLVPAGSDTILASGMARINFHFVPDEVRREILERHTPLGDILIRHNVLRTVEPRWYLRIPTESPMAASFGSAPARKEELWFGRIATIHFQKEAAVELLEIVTGAPREGDL